MDEKAQDGKTTKVTISVQGPAEINSSIKSQGSAGAGSIGPYLVLTEVYRVGRSAVFHDQGCTHIKHRPKNLCVLVPCAKRRDNDGKFFRDNLYYTDPGGSKIHVEQQCGAFP